MNFTCPYGTFPFKHMPFGLYNALDVFQRCMMIILSNMVKNNIKVFRYDFVIVGDSSNDCVKNLENSLKMCEECNLVLNL